MIDEIRNAAYYIPTEVMQADVTNSASYWYLKGITAGRQQAINIIANDLKGKCDHVYGSDDGKCLICYS